MQYPGHFTRESFGYSDKYGWTEKGWERWLEYRQELYAYWAWLSKRRFHALPEDKGIPVPHTGRSRWHSAKDSGKTGVIGSSRMLPHRYMDEGDKGKGHNRHIKRLERSLWQREWEDESNALEDASTASEWFASLDDEWWEYDDTDDYPTWVDMGCGDEQCKICEREFNLNVDLYDDDFCGHCGGPCTL